VLLPSELHRGAISNNGMCSTELTIGFVCLYSNKIGQLEDHDFLSFHK